MIDQDVVADDGGFTNDYAHPVVNYESAADGRGRVDLNSGNHSTPVSPNSGEGLELDGPKKVCLAVIPEGV